MAEITFDPLEELDPLNAASLNTRFATVRGGLNDLPTDALAPNALNENHLPTLVTASPSIRVGSFALTHSYTSAAYTVITRAGNDLEIDFGADIALGANNGVGGILVFCEVFARRLRNTSNVAPYSRRGAKAFFRISAAPSAGGAYAAITRTERYFQSTFEGSGGGGAAAYPDHAGTSQRFVIPIQTLIAASDSATVRKIRVETKVAVDAGHGGDTQTLLLRECFLSALVLRSSKV
jgi:hypothetical protein